METRIKKPRGRKGGLRPSLTWQQRYEQDPNGTATVQASIPHQLGRRIEWMAKEAGISVPAMLVKLAERAIDNDLIV